MSRSLINILLLRRKPGPSTYVAYPAFNFGFKTTWRRWKFSIYTLICSKERCSIIYCFKTMPHSIHSFVMFLLHLCYLKKFYYVGFLKRQISFPWVVGHKPASLMFAKLFRKMWALCYFLATFWNNSSCCH